MQIAKLILKQKTKVSPILKLQHCVNLNIKHWNKKKHTKQWKRTDNPEARMSSLLMRNKFFKQMVIILLLIGYGVGGPSVCFTFIS